MIRRKRHHLPRTHFTRVIRENVHAIVFLQHGRTQRVNLSRHPVTGHRIGHSRCTAVALPLS